MILGKGKAMQIAVAQGPFTSKNTLSYQPLKDFLKKAKAEKPHAVILNGPFIDSHNELIESCEIYFEKDENHYFRTYE